MEKKYAPIERLVRYLGLGPLCVAFFLPGVFYLLSVFLSKKYDIYFASCIIDLKQYFLFFSLLGLIFVAALMLFVRNGFPGFFDVDQLPPRDLASYFLAHNEECGYSSVIAYVALHISMHFFYGSILFSFVLFIG